MFDIYRIISSFFFVFLKRLTPFFQDNKSKVFFSIRSVLLTWSSLSPGRARSNLVALPNFISWGPGYMSLISLVYTFDISLIFGPIINRNWKHVMRTCTYRFLWKKLSIERCIFAHARRHQKNSNKQPSKIRTLKDLF